MSSGCHEEGKMSLQKGTSTLLCEAYSDIKTMTHIKDHNGNTPLHLALYPGVDSTVIRLMIEACPNAACEKDKEGL